jgi:pimeloyl-ACP methyl ester carboxylesterase
MNPMNSGSPKNQCNFRRVQLNGISIPGRGQEKLAAYELMPGNGCGYVLIVCHGFRGAKENGGRIFDWAQRVNQVGLGVLAFDFAGSGASSGDFAAITLTQQLHDLLQVIDYADRRYHKPIILLGRSFGGSTVLATAGKPDDRVAGYIFWSTPVKLNETFAGIANQFDQLGSGAAIEVKDERGCFKLKSNLIEDFANHDMINYAKKMVSQPVLIIHGTADEVVAPDNAVCLYQNCRQAELHIIAGADHRFSKSVMEREDITLRWLKKTFIDNQCNRDIKHY